jgi:hypothetical protein
MDDRMQLIEQLDNARQMMHNIVDEIDPDLEIYEGWTIKDLLAHLTGWDDSTIASLEAHIAGDAPATPAARGIDYYNTQTVETRQSLDLEHVLREWEFTRERLKKLILEMPRDKIEQTLVVAWGSTGTVRELVQIFAEHEEEHAVEIQGIMKRKSKVG